MIDVLVKAMAILLMAVIVGFLAQESYLKELKRQQYCEQGGIGNGGAYCNYEGGSP